MRLGLLYTVCLALVTLGNGFPARAQMVREHDVTTLRSFHGGPSRIKRSFKSDSEARAVLSQILAASGLAGMEDRILIRASAETANAEASIEKDERLIFYNALFMQQIAAKTGDYWSMVAIVAHEVGHHVRLHTVIDGRAHEFELEADYHAGFVIRRMGGTLEQALGPFRTFPVKDTPTHPGRDQRMQAVTLGWTDAGAPKAPGWAKAPLPAQPGPAESAPAQKLAEVNRQAEEKRREAEAAERQRVALLEEQQRQVAAEEQRRRDTEARRATVLLALGRSESDPKSGPASLGAPILCLEAVCYIGQSAAKPALPLPRKTALGSKNSLEQRAGDCNESWSCIFRGVGMGDGSGALQPINLGLVRHHRREAGTASPDPICETHAGKVICGKAIVGKDWIAWVVPEEVAAKAGASALDAALAALPERLPIAAWRGGVAR